MKRQPKGSKNGGQFAPDARGAAVPTITKLPHGRTRRAIGHGSGAEVEIDQAFQVVSARTLHAQPAAAARAAGDQWEFQPDPNDPGPVTAADWQRSNMTADLMEAYSLEEGDQILVNENIYRITDITLSEEDDDYLLYVVDEEGYRRGPIKVSPLKKLHHRSAFS